VRFDVVPYDRRRYEHRAFVEDGFLRSVTEGRTWPWSLVSWDQLREDLRRRLRHPGTRCALAVVPGCPDDFLGWAAVQPAVNELIYAFTPAGYRTSKAEAGKKRFEPRIASSLVTRLGLDLTRQVSCRYWTRALEALAQHPGYHLHPTTETR
jgi:hypothetical protein